jgi:hypothetical protein
LSVSSSSSSAAAAAAAAAAHAAAAVVLCFIFQAQIIKKSFMHSKNQFYVLQICIQS